MQRYLHSVIITTILSSALFVNPFEIAQAAPLSSLAIGPNIGTTGIGVQVSTALWSDYLNLTAGYSGFGLGYHGTSDGQGYHGDLRLGGAPIYLSAYPFSLPFHLDVGLFINQNRIDVETKANNGIYVFNGHSYTQNELGQVSGKTHWNTVAPYLGIGWGNPLVGSRWTFTANAGVILEGGADSRIGAANEDEVPGARQNIEVYQSTFNNHLSFLTAFPVVNIGFDYRF